MGSGGGVTVRNFQVHCLRPPTLPSRVGYYRLKDLPGGPQHQGLGLRSFIYQRTHRPNPPPPHRDSGARDSSDRSSRRSHIDWHCLAARAPGARASGASSAESSGARGGHQGRRARGLPSARMSAGAGGSRSPSGGEGGRRRGPHPAFAGPRARAARPCLPPFLPPSRESRLAWGSREGARADGPAPPPPSAAAERAGSSQGLGGGGGVWPQLLLLLLLHLLAPSICRGYGPSLEHKRVSAAGVGVALAFPRWGVR